MASKHIVLLGAEYEENLAIRYISGALTAKGHIVQQIVFNNKSDIPHAAAELANCQAPLAGFSMVFTSRAREFAELAQTAKRLGFKGRIAAGGHFATFHAKQLLTDVPEIDFVAIGEGEELMCNLAESLDAPSAVPGLVWRDPSGKIVRNQANKANGDLDSLPPPLRKTPPDDYLGLPIANMLSSRGCSHACHFCSIAAWHKLCGSARIRFRNLDNVVAEMRDLYNEGYRIFNFHDDNFLPAAHAASLERAESIKSKLRSEGLTDIAFAIKARPDSVDEDVFNRLKEAGLFRVFLGIEAGTPESLTNLGRRQTVAANIRAINTLNDLGLHTCYNLLLFNPWSTIEDFRGNLEFMRKHNRNPLNFCRTEVYTGTPLEKRLRERGRLEGDYWGYNYTIYDPTAQEAFELMHAALYSRNHAPDNLHHMTMSVDYEYQLLAHFSKPDSQLQKKVKAFIQKVNFNSFEFLSAIADAAEAGFKNDASRANFIDDLKNRLSDANTTLRSEGNALSAQIRSKAQPATIDIGWLKAAASLGLAAGVALTASCQRQKPKGGRTHVFERAAAPLPSNAVKVPRQTSKDPLNSTIIQAIAPLIPNPQDIEIEIWTDGEKKVAYAAVYSAKAKKGDAEPKQADINRARMLLDALSRATDPKRCKTLIDQLTMLGEAAANPTKEAFASSDSPEKRERYLQVIDGIEGLFKTPKYTAIVELLCKQNYEKANTRIRARHSAASIRKANPSIMPNDTHMFEIIAIPPEERDGSRKK